jgi:flavodoxin
MKTLVVFYSRTGTTKRVGEEIAKALKSDVEEIKDLAGNRLGIKGWIISGKESSLKKLPLIKKIERDLSKYDLVIIGTPVWAFTMASPIRTFIKVYKNEFKNVAFFCTHEGGPKNTLKNMEELSGKKAIVGIDINRKRLDKEIESKIKFFINRTKDFH